MPALEKLKYPIGKYEKPLNYTNEILREYISVIENFPARISAETLHLPDDQLETPYRPDGWTLRQVVNHCADSHLNAFARFKLALTENKPVIKPYLQDDWATLPDSRTMPIAPALQIIEGVHARWTVLIKQFGYNEWKRGFFHPEYDRFICLDESAGNYAWHCRHHLAHITALKKRMRWK